MGYQVTRAELEATLLLQLSQRQRQTVELKLKGMTEPEIAAELGVTERVVRYHVLEARKKLIAAGVVPSHGLTEALPPGISLDRATIQRDGEGKIERVWTKTKTDKPNAEKMTELIITAVEGYKGAGGVVKAPRTTSRDTMTVYPMGDPHLGMYAWGAETGEDFDVDIAERNLTEAMSRLVGCSVNSETALILNLGDFFHSDNNFNRTARNENSLDVDSRWGRVFQIGFRAMIQCIDEARSKHKKVVVKNLIGNHDDHTSQALAVALDAFFHKDKRVQIDTKPEKFWYYQFQKVLIAAGHGDTAKPDQLPNIMAADRPEMWGSTKHRYWYTGHIHSQNQKEYAGVIWESFKTLAGKDAWHAAQGYRSGRDMFCIIHHKDHGEIERHRVDVGMLGGG